MIPEIGVLLAAYIITRMLALLATRVDAGHWLLVAAQIIVRVAAVGTILVAVFVAIDLLFSAARGVQLPTIR